MASSHTQRTPCLHSLFVSVAAAGHSAPSTPPCRARPGPAENQQAPRQIQLSPRAGPGAVMGTARTRQMRPAPCGPCPGTLSQHRFQSL